MTVFSDVATALATLSLPYACGIYMVATGSSLPDVFLTYMLVSSAPRQHADDDETLEFERVQVSYFSRSGLASLPDVEGAMKEQGFMFARRFQLAYDQVTGHYGMGWEFTVME